MPGSTRCWMKQHSNRRNLWFSPDSWGKNINLCCSWLVLNTHRVCRDDCGCFSLRISAEWMNDRQFLWKIARKSAAKNSCGAAWWHEWLPPPPGSCGARAAHSSPDPLISLPAAHIFYKKPRWKPVDTNPGIFRNFELHPFSNCSTTGVLFH